MNSSSNQIADSILNLKNELAPFNARLIAVSKTKPVEMILEAMQAGQIDFGENYVQELDVKQKQISAPIQWHFIGHLQTNKVKYIAPFISFIHSVDSLKLLHEINKEAQKNKRIINCLLEMYIATEETKFGLDLSESIALLESPEYKKMKNIRICGVMGMATFTEDLNRVRTEFKNLTSYFNQIKTRYFSNEAYFKEISMGMSNDYEIAIQEGSTLVRIGTSIFGSR